MKRLSLILILGFLLLGGVLRGQESPVSLATAEDFGVLSLEGVLDDGRVMVRGVPVGKAGKFVGGYLLDGAAESRATPLFACEPAFNPFDFAWTVRWMGVSPEESGEFLALRQEQTDATGTRYARNLVLGSDGSGKASPCDGFVLGVNGAAFGYSFTDNGLVLGRLEANAFQQQRTLAPKNYDGLPPVATADFSEYFYLSREGDKESGIRRGAPFAPETEPELLFRLGNQPVLDSQERYSCREAVWMACSPQGDALAFPYRGGDVGKTRQFCLAEKNALGEWSRVVLSKDEAYDPCFSENGRFLLYRRQDGTLVRHDRNNPGESLSLGTGEWMAKSGISEQGALCALSPNGRYVSWIDAEGRVLRADLGASLRVSEAVLVVSPLVAGRVVSLGVEVSGAQSEDSISWSLADPEAEFPGTIRSSDGEEKILPGEKYSVATLPWVVSGLSEEGRYVLVYTLNDGACCQQEIRASNFRSLAPELVAGTSEAEVYAYGALHFADANALLALSSAPLDNHRHAADAFFQRTVASADDWQARTADKDTPVSGQQGASGELYWVEESTGALHRGTTVVLDSGVSAAEGDLRVSWTGAVVACLRRNGEGASPALLFSEDGGDTWSQVASPAYSPVLSASGESLAWLDGEGKLQCRFGRKAKAVSLLSDRSFSALWGMTLDGAGLLCQEKTSGAFLWVKNASSGYNSPTVRTLPLPTNATAVSLSGNGRRLCYQATPEGEKSSRVYLLDLSDASAEPRCLTPKATRAVESPALSPSGRYVAMVSCADLTLQGTQDTATGAVVPFLWEDPAWSNSAPDFNVTKLNDLQEDCQETNLRLGSIDADGDAVGVWIAQAASHGALRLAPPDGTMSTTRIYYKPEADFCGEDAFVLGITDGTVSREVTWKVTVTPVNDPPVWSSEKMTASVALVAGEATTLPLYVDDPDLKDPVPDTLSFAVEPAVGWACVSATPAGESQGVLTLSPEFVHQGTGALLLRVTDAAGASAEYSLAYAVSLPPAVTPTLALLREGSPAPVDPTTSQERLLSTLAGCWKEIPEGRWSPLSLPGESSVAELCQALGTEFLLVLNDSRTGYLQLREGTLPAGTGFWACPHWNSEASLTVTPAVPDGDRSLFRGPSWGEAFDLPEESSGWFWGVSGNAWGRGRSGDIGRGYILPAPKDGAH